MTAARAALAVAVLSSGSVVVDVDRGRTFQLLDNLISNAIAFTLPARQQELVA